MWCDWCGSFFLWLSAPTPLTAVLLWVRWAVCFLDWKCMWHIDICACTMHWGIEARLTLTALLYRYHTIFHFWIQACRYSPQQQCVWWQSSWSWLICFVGVSDTAVQQYIHIHMLIKCICAWNDKLYRLNIATYDSYRIHSYRQLANGKYLFFFHTWPCNTVVLCKRS